MTPTLAGDGVVLRPLVITDTEALFVALSDPDVQHYRRAGAHTDIAETQAYIETSIACGFAWAITEDGGEALGRLALRVNRDFGEFGIVIRRAAQGRGFGRQALALAEEYAFTVLGLKQLRAEIDAENAASLALFARAGFAREALLQHGRESHRGVRDNVVMVKARC